MQPRLFCAVFSTALLFCLGACRTTAPVDNTGIAYVASASVNLRGDIAQKNTVAVLKHGDRVKVLDQKRRYVQIRAANGVTGWVDAFQLLSPEQMAELQKQHVRALSLPSEGTASVYEALNVHLEPNRQSPSFAQIPEGGFVQVLEYKLAPRATVIPRPPVFTVDRPQPERRERKRKEKRETLRLPPKPPPPGLPPNYDELSAPHFAEPKPAASGMAQPAVKPPVMEEWTLVRLKNNETGWVLSRNLYMAIPDEVAQYAEGKRITSYFSLGEVKDEETGVVKHDWLWTTLSEAGNYDFDGWRVFLWSRRHHRFETSYRQRDVEGYFPVRVDGNQFTLITKDDDGKLRQRTYNFDGTLVHLAQTEEYHPESAAAPSQAAATNRNAKQPGWFGRLWNKLRGRR